VKPPAAWWRGAVLLLALIAMPWQRLTANAWALQWLRYRAGGGARPAEVSPASSRAPLWLAQEALDQGQPQRALDWLAAFGAEDSLALRQRGLALQALGRYEEAVQAFLQAGDDGSLATLARQLQTAGDLDLALTAYRVRRVLEPERGVNDLANFLANARGNPAAAEAVLRQALAQSPRSSLRSRWLLTLGGVLRKAGKYAEAAAAYQQFLALDPPDAWRGYIGLGWTAYERDGDVEAAVQAFRQAIAVEPERGDGYAALGNLYRRAKEYAAAESWFRQAVERAPENRWWWLSLANLQRAQGKDAAPTYRQIIDQFPDFAAAYYELAWQYHLNGDDASAAQAIEAAIQHLEAPNPWYYVRAGAIYEAQNRTEAAIAAYVRALAVQPGHAGAQDALQRLGDRFRREGDFTQAAQIYRQLIQVGVAWRGYLGLGWVAYERDGDVEAAAQAFRQAIAADSARGDGYYAMGVLFNREKDYAAAETWFQQAVNHNPKASWWWLSLANAQRAQGKDATATYREIIRRFPDFAAGYYELAWQEHLLGAEEDAIQAIEQAIRLMQPPNAWYYVRAGQIYEAAGRPDQALEAYRQALNLQPGNTVAQQGVERLSNHP